MFTKVDIAAIDGSADESRNLVESPSADGLAGWALVLE
jgi:hypothetical protein